MTSKPVHSRCQNCSATLLGPFCHHCGQHDFDVSRSFHHVFLEALENFFHFDTKFFRNVVTLLLRPGALSADYNAGKRASQMPPFRLYLFISVLFFFVGFLSGHPAIRLAAPNPAAVQPGAPEASLKNNPSLTSKPLRAVPGESFWAEKLNHFTEHRTERADELAHAFPKILIVCLPLFALFTRFLFRSEGQTYLQHLVVAVHFHTFIFLWKMVGDGWGELFNLFSDRIASVAAGGVTVWFILYPLLMFRRLYGKPWLQTILESLLLFVVYIITIVGCFIATAGLLFFLQ